MHQAIVVIRVPRWWNGPVWQHALLDGRARNRLADTTDSGGAGAWAALECHYHAFNQRNLSVMRSVWSVDPGARLDRPSGATAFGVDAICAEYAAIFARPNPATLSLADVTAFVGADQAVFVGTEIVDYAGGHGIRCRTTRCFRYQSDTGRWQQFHHHGSRTTR